MSDFAFPLNGPITLAVRIGHGSVTVETAPDLDAATVRLTAGKHAQELLKHTTVELHGAALAVVAPRQGGVFDLPLLGKWTGRGLDVHVTVPDGTTMQIKTFTAPIRILGTAGDSDLSFGAGEAAVRDVAGNLRVRYGSGTIRAVHVSGDVQLRSGSGDAEFGDLDGDLMAGSGSGDLSARVVRGRVRSRCGSGSARLGEVHGDVDLVSGSGQLEVGLPAGTSARVDAHTGSGQVTSDLPVDDRPADRAKAITLRLRSGSGDIRIVRAGAVEAA